MNRITIQIGYIGPVIAVLSVLLLIATGPGYANGIWSLGMAFTLMSWAAVAGIVNAVICVVAAFVRKSETGWRYLVPYLAAAVIGIVVFVIPYTQQQKAKSLPRIHDITTDIQNPPAFKAALPLRKDARNPAIYPGPMIGKLQRQAYPNVQPVMLPVPQAEAFRRARAAVDALGWDLIDAEPAEGRIEASETTFWFGFTDDVVIRILPTASGSRIDIRSKSRIGLSDVGANAARIERFIEQITD